MDERPGPYPSRDGPAPLEVVYWEIQKKSEMLNLWKGFIELVHYIDENKEWLDRELEICKHLKY